MIETLINLSGGIDSTYYTWRYTQENKDIGVLIHNMIFPNTSRNRLELKSVYATLRWLDKIEHEYKFVQSELNYKDLTKIHDVETVGHMIGVIFRDTKSYPDLKNSLVSTCLEEISTDSDRSRVRAQIATIIAGREINFMPCYKSVSKAEMYFSLPEELRNYVWYCRFPRRGSPCGACPTCKLFKDSLKNYNLNSNANT